MNSLTKYCHMRWIVITKRRSAAIFVEPESKNPDTPEGFYYLELDQRSDLTGRAIAHGYKWQPAMDKSMRGKHIN